MRAVFIAVMLLIPSAAAVPYLQYGGDATNSRSTMDLGPAALELAYRFDQSIDRIYGSPVIIGTDVWFLASAYKSSTVFTPIGSSADRSTSQLWHVSLVTGNASVIWSQDDPGDHATRPGVGAMALASDGERLFVAWSGHLVAVGFDGQEEGRVAVTDWVQPQCARLLVADGHIFVGCAAVSGPLTIAAFDAGSLQRAWAYERGLEDDVVDAGAPGYAFVSDMALVGGQLLVLLSERDRYWQTVNVLAFDAETGDVRDRALESPDFGSLMFGNHADTVPAAAREAAPVAFGQMVATPDRIFVSTPSQTVALDPEDLRVIWRLPKDPTFDGDRMAVQEDRLLLHGPTIYQSLNADDRIHHWQHDNVGGNRWFGLPVLATGRGFAGQASGDIIAYDARTGEVVDRALHLSAEGVVEAAEVAVGEGLVVAHGDNGLTVWGRTPMSIQPVVDAPARALPGDTIRIDLSETRPGRLAGDVEFRIDWGDGTSRAGNAVGSVGHVYAEGEYDITVRFSNSAGQTARWTGHIVVAQPEAPPTFLESAFSQERQESTFFILGLLITAVFAAFGAARIGRRRRRLRRELEAVDAAFEASRGGASGLRRAMDEARTRGRGLLAAGLLDESQFTALNAHIDQLLSGTRRARVEDEMPFLPYSLVERLDDMLADGRISKWERSDFAAAVAADTILSAGQKKHVLSLVDEWFRADA